MKNFNFVAATVLLTFAAISTAAEPPEPPAFSGQAVPAQSLDTEDRTPYKADSYSRLEPSAEDMARARAHRQKSKAQSEPFISKRGTIIEERHDQNNRLTEIRVTPGTTEIPYTMKNTSDRPIDNRPGADPRSTLDTPKFIQFGW